MVNNLLIGVGILAFLVALFLIRKRIIVIRKNKKYPIKKIKECDNDNCTEHFQIQGRAEQFNTIQDAENFRRRLK